MKQFARITVVSLAVTLLFAGGVVLATPDYGEELDLKCTACHDKAGSKRLTDFGKYFETTGSLDGFDELSAEFSKCTTCHVRKPGSLRLTKTGKKFASVAGSMSELRDWLKERHPDTDREDQPSGGGSYPVPIPLAPAH